ELVVARNRLGNLVAARTDPELEQISGQVDSLVRSLHGLVIKARLAPVSELFGRFPRVVRDLGESLGKMARLELGGEGIELDRAMLEELVEPLIHLLRNAVDHGVEHPADRVAAGKPAEATLRLGAGRRREWIVIRLEDDGRGIDRDAVVRRATERGLLPSGAGADLSDADVLQLLVRPGFSTKAEVTEVSGRGVGLDVVASKVRALGGTLGLRSESGQGTVFEITVPLTTAVQRVLLVGADGERYAIPFRLVREAVLPGRTETASGNGRFTFRDRSVPFVDLADLVGRRGADIPSRRPVLVLEWGSRDGAVAVDTLLGQHDVLLERIEAPDSLPGWVSGATILADGAPAFVLDPTAFF
ncbi:MAG: chemotaxis protein CheA, partial [Gemmatimonadales bacterium]